MIWQPSKQEALVVLAVLAFVTLLFLDFRTPVEQTFPSSATGVFAGRTAAEIFLCDEASGNLVGEVASNALIGTGSPTQGLTASGFWNDTNAFSKKCVEFSNAGNMGFAHASTAFANYDASTSFACLVVYRVTSTPSVNWAFVNKLSTIGWRLIHSNSNGLQIGLDDGPVVQNVHANSGGIGDGGWHCAMAVVDRASGKVQCHTDLNSGTSTTLTVGSLETSGTIFKIGSTGTPPIQVAYLALFEGAEAEGLGAADLNEFWTHASVPTNPQVTYTRTGTIHSNVGYESGFGLRVGAFGGNQWTPWYDSTYSHASKLGLLSEPVRTNLCLYSDDATNAAWTNVNLAAPTKNTGECPTGAKRADTLTATANNGYQGQTLVTTAETPHTWYRYVRRKGVSDVDGHLRIQDLTGAVELANEPFTATSEWQRVVLTATTNVGQISTSFRISIDTSGESIEVWGADFKQEDKASSHVRTEGVSVTRGVPLVTLVNTGGNTYFKTPRGEVEITFSLHANLSNLVHRYLLDTANTGINRHNYYQHHLEYPAAIVRDFTSAIGHSSVYSPAVDTSAETEYRFRWDSQNVIPGTAVNHDVVVNGTKRGGTAATWVGTDTEAPMTIGAIGAGTNCDGSIAFIRIYDRPRAEAV